MVVDTNIYGSYINDVKIADMNNDGYQDLLLAHVGGPGRIAMYLNDSSGAFGNELIISNNQYSNMAVDYGDFDLNGHLDLIAISKPGGVLTKYMQDNSGQFTQIDIFTGIFFPLDVITLDLNQDGYLDFVSLGDTEILAFTNDSSANFFSSTIANFTEFYSFCIGDLNTDGYPDLIAGSVGFYTFINDGNGALVRDTTNESINTPQIHVSKLADMDGDNDLDLVVYYTNTIDKVEWYSNNGEGVMTKESTITDLANNVHDITLGDIDLDNKVDLSLGYDQVDKLVWIKNLGTGNFSSEIIINSDVLLPLQIELGDFDNDGDLDLCHSANDGIFYYINNTLVLSINEENEQGVSWYPNPSNGPIFIRTKTYSAISIYNLHGMMVYNIKLPEGEHRIDPGLPQGMYVLKIQNEEGNKQSILVQSD
jgi:hypothetical protein